MSEIPDNLRYTKDHEWLRPEPDGTAVVGITDYAQSSLGDIVFVELPRPGVKFNAHGVFGVIESVKAASDLYLPVAGEVLEVNRELETKPETVNQQPYGGGWMLRMRPADPAAVAALLDAAAYRALV